MIRRAVVCDECFIEAETPDGLLLGMNAVDARSQARKFGWKIAARRDLCPNCAEDAR